MALIVQDVLDHPLLRRARPVLLSGEDHLDHVVRWVHTADLYEIAPLLRGDEVLLTNGVGLIGIDETGRRLYVRRLAESGVAGLFFEVGRTFTNVPAEMVDEAAEVGLPIVELQPGQAFYAPANIAHWHGAAPGSAVTMLSLYPIGSKLTPGAEVTESEYLGKALTKRP